MQNNSLGHNVDCWDNLDSTFGALLSHIRNKHGNCERRITLLPTPSYSGDAQTDDLFPSMRMHTGDSLFFCFCLPFPSEPRLPRHEIISAENCFVDSIQTADRPNTPEYSEQPSRPGLP